MFLHFRNYVSKNVTKNLCKFIFSFSIDVTKSLRRTKQSIQISHLKRCNFQSLSKLISERYDMIHHFLSGFSAAVVCESAFQSNRSADINCRQWKSFALKRRD